MSWAYSPTLAGGAALLDEAPPASGGGQISGLRFGLSITLNILLTLGLFYQP